MSRPLPPADVRALAALCHVGIYAFGASSMALHILAEVLGLREFGASAQPYSHLSDMVLLAGSVYVPGIAALWAARGAPWSGFLRSHATRALFAHEMVSLIVLGANVFGGAAWVPQGLDVPLASLAPTAIFVWFILVLGAAFRAKDGDLAWYPLATRIYPDPPTP